MTDYQYDVFLSYNAADKPRVRRLAERLLPAGMRPMVEWRVQNAEALPSTFYILPFMAVGLEHSTGGRGNLPFRDSANAGARFIPLLLADAHRREEPVAICDLESS